MREEFDQKIIDLESEIRSEKAVYHQKYESEVTSHLETKSRLNASENKSKSLSEMLESLTSNNSNLKSKMDSSSEKVIFYEARISDMQG